MVKIAIFASGNGSNFQRIVEAQQNNETSGFIVTLLITDKKDAYAIERAKKLGIKYYFVDFKSFSTKSLFENEIVKILKSEKVDFIVLAGYMRIISATLLNEYPKKIINIHPSYLPEFPGRNGIEDAYKSGVEKTGVTIHYVDSGIDTGEIIYQERIAVNKKWNLEEFEREIHKVEYRIYPYILTKILNERKNNL